MTTEEELEELRQTNEIIINTLHEMMEKIHELRAENSVLKRSLEVDKDE